MLILKVISALLSYPRTEIMDAWDEMAAAVESDEHLSDQEKAGLKTLLEAYGNTDRVELQQRYVELFDRGRALSLHLFEHIHGESRDRGQAMVDLMRVYQTHGFEMATRELPDYIPLFLEYLSQRPAEEALELLRGALPVLKLLGARLAERQSAYSILFGVLASLAGDSGDNSALRRRAATEGEDETLVRMDEIWEEEAVSFLGNPSQCQDRTPSIKPVKFTPRGCVAATRPTP